jgi:hypothetical protein
MQFHFSSLNTFHSSTPQDTRSYKIGSYNNDSVENIIKMIEFEVIG